MTEVIYILISDILLALLFLININMKTLIGDLPYICGCVEYLVDCTMFVSRLFLDTRKQLYSLVFIGGAWFDCKMALRHLFPLLPGLPWNSETLWHSHLINFFPDTMTPSQSLS